MEKQMELDIITLNELSQTQNDRQEFCDVFHVWEIGSGRT